MPADLGVAFDGREAPEEVLDLAREAEAAGVRTLWFAAHLFNREPIATAALALAATSRVKIALMALSPYTVHPVYAAMAAATLDEWFPGRVELCLGVGAPRDLEAAGVAAPRPLATLRESLAVARALLAGETVAHAGERFQVHGRRLATGPRAVPLLLAASGPRMLALAGAVADGVVISAATAPAFVAWTLDRVRRGGRAVRRAAPCTPRWTRDPNRPTRGSAGSSGSSCVVRTTRRTCIWPAVRSIRRRWRTPTRGRTGRVSRRSSATIWFAGMRRAAHRRTCEWRSTHTGLPAWTRSCFRASPDKPIAPQYCGWRWRPAPLRPNGSSSRGVEERTIWRSIPYPR